MNIPPAVTFEPALDTDAEALVQLRIAAMRESLEHLGRFGPVRARERFLVAFEAARTRFIVCEQARVGFLVLTPIANAIQLDHLYIHPDHQNRGIGRVVREQVFADADLGGAKILVGALRGSGSNRFYERHGFTKTSEGEWDIYYSRAAKA